jgi:hypothetical protein
MYLIQPLRRGVSHEPGGFERQLLDDAGADRRTGGWIPISSNITRRDINDT